MVEFIGVQEETRGKLNAVASGTLSNGDTVVVNSDGTVSAVAAISASASTSSPATFNTQTSDVSVVYDSANDKLVFVYRDNANNNYGTAAVGTLSGSTITFGSEVVFNTASVEPMDATYDENSGKIVVAYRDNGNSGYGTAIVGTVSGTSISFGSKVVFKSGSSSLQCITYHAATQKVVVAYRDNSDGNDGAAQVGTVSGTSISFGSRTEFVAASRAVGGNRMGITYDSSSEKIVITYRDQDFSGYGTSVVGTVSGTSISFGTPVVHSSASTYWSKCAYDENTNKVLVAFTTSTGQAIVGTVSGTSISFGTASTFNSNFCSWTDVVYDEAAKVVTIAYDASSTGKLINATISGTSVSFGAEVEFETGTTSNIGVGFDSTANKVIIGYKDQSNTEAGTYVVRQNAYTSTNITAENYIGISSTTVADTETATIDIIGTTNNAQSGLTAGQKYYVQNDGTLSTTADDPSVLAGTALSATKLVVKT